MNKSKIIDNLNTFHSVFWETAIQLPNPAISINGKWSVCQNVQHITIGLLRLSNYLALPKASIKSNFGLSERVSANYEISIKMFRNALENGVKTTDAFKPEINLETKIEELVSQGKDSLAVFITNLQNWSEEELEMYSCPHPIFGKITVREILYFTIYHVQHHNETIKKMKNKSNNSFSRTPEKLVLEFFDRVWHNPHELGAIDELMTEDYSITTAGKVVTGRNEFKNWVGEFQKQLLDAKTESVDIFYNEKENKVVSRWICSGRNNGLFGLEPDNRHISFSGIAIWTVANNRLSECWIERSAYELYQNLISGEKNNDFV